MKSVVILFQIVIVCFLLPEAKTTLNLNEVTFGGIKINDNSSKILKSHGKPDSVISTYNFVEGDTIQVWYYKNDIIIYLVKGLGQSDDFKVNGINITSNKVNTSLGLNVGNNKDKIISILGKPVKIVKDCYYYGELNEGLILSFKLKTNNINEISIGYSYLD